MVPTASLYGYSSESVASAFHDAAGWAMLVLALGVLFGSLRALRWSLVPVTRYPVAYQVHQR